MKITLRKYRIIKRINKNETNKIVKRSIEYKLSQADPTPKH